MTDQTADLTPVRHRARRRDPGSIASPSSPVSPTGSGCGTLFPAAQRPADLERPSGPLYRRAVRLRVRQRHPRDRRRADRMRAYAVSPRSSARNFDTTGVLGVSDARGRPNYVGFPAWATIPSVRDLATGRVVHFFFAWILVATLAIWLIASLANRHFWRDILLKPRDLAGLPPTSWRMRNSASITAAAIRRCRS